MYAKLNFSSSTSTRRLCEVVSATVVAVMRQDLSRSSTAASATSKSEFELRTGLTNQVVYVGHSVNSLFIFPSALLP